MKLLVINPNTSVEMTEDCRVTVEAVRDKDVEVDVVCPDFGPRSLESFYDYTLAGFAMYRMFETKWKNYDGVLVACYGDPGLYGIKEMLDVPVLGIAEASIALSTLMGQKFAILAASNKAIPMMKDMVNQYGMTARLACVKALNISVLDVEANKDNSVKRLIEVGREAMAEGAEVMLLGCAGMTGMKKPVEDALGAPVIDPVETGYKMLEMFAKNGIRQSKAGLYAKPAPKEIVKNELLNS